MSTQNLDWLSKMTNESDTDLLSLLLKDAEEYVLSETRRTVLIAPLNSAVKKLALYAYNRLGTEGESGRSEAGESYSFDNAPQSILSAISRYQIVRCGGHAYEKVSDEDVSTAEPDNNEG